MNDVFTKLAMNVENRRERRCVIGKVTPKKFVWHKDGAALNLGNMKSSFGEMASRQHLRSMIAQAEAAKKQQAAANYIAFATEGFHSLWYFAVSLAIAFVVLLGIVYL